MDALVLGLTLGLGAGLAPGPLLALVIRTSLERGFAAGARVAVAPLITDVPIVLASVLLAASLPDAALGVLGIAGGLFVCWLGVEAVRATPEPGPSGGGELRRGVLLNVLSPHPWIFWVTVGAPILADQDAAGAAVFLATFYALLVGTKVVIAALLAVGRERLLRGRGFALAVRGSGVLLLAAGVLLAVEGVRLL
ncbi:MAG: LysE family transporter [Solirubrobacterales bacterium]|nr:LysE family transporter [Solirubrobacterales bacterium]